MPEGPSIVILKEQISKLHLEGQPVIAVAGTAAIPKNRLLNERVLAFKSWGKHFLICFNDFTLRIHLMLFGSYRINEQKMVPAALSVSFDHAQLNFYTCSVKFIEGDINLIYDWSADVMSADWDPQRALKKLKARPKTLVCDALLDQNLFSGVGNIIKNEVLYRIKIHPLSDLGALPTEKLKELIREARNYSFDFFKWKKEGTLKAHWLAHTKANCLRCNLPMQKLYLGKTKRRTFYCPNCQKEWKILKTGVLTLF